MSEKTTYLGPLVSFRTSAAQANTPIHVEIPSTGTFTLAGKATVTGPLTSTATVDLTAGKLLSKSTVASVTSLVAADGEFFVTSVGTGAAILAFRSGATTYRWSSTTGTVV